MRPLAIRAKVRPKTLWRVLMTNQDNLTSYVYARGATASDAMASTRGKGLGRAVSAVRADAFLQKSTLGMPRGHKGKAYK